MLEGGKPVGLQGVGRKSPSEAASEQLRVAQKNGSGGRFAGGMPMIS